MVATRKVPAGRSSAVLPVPSATSRATKTKAEREAVNKASSGNTSSESSSVETAKHTKLKNRNKAKRESKKKTRSKSFVEVLSQILILVFTIYSLAVCPNEASMDKPICRGLSAYRKYVLDPYVIPPLQQFILQPIERTVVPFVADTLDKPSVRPYVVKYVALQNNWVLPAAGKAQDVWTARLVPQWRKRVVPAWNKHVAPQWEKRIVPAWNAYVVPQWNVYVGAKYEKYVTPKVEQYVTPWIVKAAVYRKQVRAWTRAAHIQYRILEKKSRPYVAFAVEKSQQAAIKGKELYVLSKPYREHVRALLVRGLEVLKAQRVLYVDPHVARLWEKIVELSSSSSPTSSVTHRTHTTKGEFKIQTEEVKRTPVTSVPIAVATKSTVSSVVPETTGEVLASTAEIVVETSTVVSTPSVVVEVSTTSSIVASSADVSSSSSPSPVASSVAETLASASSPVPTPASVNELPIEEELVSPVAIQEPNHVDDAASPEPEQQASPSHADDDDEDAALKAFYDEFELENSSATPEEVSSDANPDEDPEQVKLAAAEALRVKAVETAEKRAAIAVRHAEWEAKLIALLEEQRVAARQGFLVVRRTAVTELLAKPTTADSTVFDALGLLDTLNADGEKFIKGIEGYLKSISTKKSGVKTREDYDKWSAVVDKVTTKFEDKVTELEKTVHTWYLEVTEKDLQIARDASGVVRQLAEQAQADIGLDYAWLDDVTYQDWQRYHDLVRISEKFDVELAFIQNGTTSASHPATVPVVPNPLLEALDELHVEVRDVVLGFETRLRGIKRGAERAFKDAVTSDAKPEATPSEPVFPIVPVADEALSSIKAAVAVEATPSEPVFSILPVVDETLSSIKAAPTQAAEAAHAILGRGEEEVLQAFGRAEGRDRVEL